MPKDLTEKRILAAQKAEITEHLIYKKLSEATRDLHNQEILRRIAKEELGHYNILKKYTKKDVFPDNFKIWSSFIISRVLGITFGIRLMKIGEGKEQLLYKEFLGSVPEATKIEEQEERHEKRLIDLIREEHLEHVGSMILGLNDALMELTGILAGLTLAIHNVRLVFLTGLVTGIAGSLSMAASEYLSNKTEVSPKSHQKAALYAGLIYFFTVIFLIFPYFFFKNIYFCLGLTIFNAFLLILVFTFYISVVQELNFKIRFLEMTLITFGVAALSFVIGFLVRTFWGLGM